MNLKDTYNRIAEEWHKDHTSDDWWVEGTDRFVSLLKPGSFVLDVGCGSGVKSAYLTGKGLRVLGIDFSDKLIDIAKRETPGAEFRVMDMHDASALAEEFDGIFAQATFLHIPKKELAGVIEGLVQKLVSGGMFYAAVKGLRDGGPEEEVKEENEYGYPYQRFFSYYSMDELTHHFETAGLEVLYTDSKKTGRSDWLQIIGKKVSKGVE
jgi:SAM-dependent methyltransferase